MLLIGCYPNSLYSREETENNEEITTLPDSVSVSTTPKIEAKEIFRIPVNEFFKGFDKKEEVDKLKYVIPASIYVDSTGIVLFDRFNERLVKYDYNGVFIDDLNSDLLSSLVVKFRTDDLGRKYFLFHDGELVVLNEGSEIQYRDSDVMDYILRNEPPNIFLFKNSVEGRLLDDFGEEILSPLNVDYSVIELEKDTLVGLKVNKPNEFLINKLDLVSNVEVEKIIIQPCDACLIPQRFLSPNLLLSSNYDSNSDQVSLLANDKIETFVINYPEEIETLLSEQSAPYGYLGFFYFFDKKNRILYSVGSDEQYVRVFQINVG